MSSGEGEVVDFHGMAMSILEGRWLDYSNKDVENAMRVLASAYVLGVRHAERLCRSELEGHKALLAEEEPRDRRLSYLIGVTDGAEGCADTIAADLLGFTELVKRVYGAD